MSIEQPFRVGDRIELGDRGGGRVNGMNWRATHILAINGDLVVVPNSMLSRGRIVNHDSPLSSTHRSAVSIKLGNTIAPARASEVLKAAALSATGVLASPAPRVDIASYGDWAREYKVLFHFADWGDESEIASRVFGTVWSHLSWAGISQPAPRTVMMTAPPDADDGVALPTLLKRIPVFAALADDDRAQLSDCLRVRSVDAGTRLIEQGDGGQSLLTGVARNAAVEAVTAATVYEIGKADFEPFLIARFEMVEMLAHTLASRNSHRDSNAIAVPAATALTAIAN